MTATVDPPGQRDATLSVALVCMPLASADRPSIQLGLLAAIARSAGFPTRVFQLNLDLAAQLTPEIYERLCERRSHMTGEWLFARAAFGDEAPADDDAYFSRFGYDFEWAAELGKGLDFFRELRNRELPAFVDRCAEQIDWSQFDVVGFSSLFQQNVASLALAVQIKRLYPQVTIVFGGANMEGEMGEEYARSFPYIDVVVSGEADDTFPSLLRALAAGTSPALVPGVIAPGAAPAPAPRPPAPVNNLDRLPVPEYDAYFQRSAELGLVDYYKSTYVLPFESSRGCWWGQKHHCTFCGLNGETMGFRAKTPERVLSELNELASRHRICSFMAVDNILDVRYIDTLFTEIEAARFDYNFFYEVKSSLTRRQIRTLHRGGVRRVQPGIESLSSHVLKLMRKGCTMLQNVRCMKWCRYYGIGVNWNLIWGFPGETEQDYARQLAVLRNLTHLEPPVGSGRIWLERFSPHYADSSFPVSHRQPEASYHYVYPAHVDLDKAAYFFDYEMGQTVPPEIHLATHEFVESWRTSWNSPDRHSLTYRRTGDGILVDRSLGPDRQGTIAISEPAATIYEYCSETMRTPARVVEHVQTVWPDESFALDDVTGALEEFCKAGLMVGEDNHYLGLALPLNPNW